MNQMWFKTFNVYQVMSDGFNAEILEDKLSEFAFSENGPKVAQKFGFISPVQHHDGLLHSVMGVSLFCLKEETRKVPSDILSEEMDREIKDLLSRGVEVDSNVKKELKESISQRLFPKVFPKTKRTFFYYDSKNKWIVMDEGSLKRGEDVASLFREWFDIQIAPLQSVDSSAKKMKSWLDGMAFPEQLAPSEKCKLYLKGKTQNKVSFVGHDISNDESVQEYLSAGYEVSELEMYYWVESDPMRFTLTEDFLVKGVSYSEYTKADVSDQSQDLASEIDSILVAVADTARSVYKKLISELGGDSTGK